MRRGFYDKDGGLIPAILMTSLLTGLSTAHAEEEETSVKSAVL